MAGGGWRVAGARKGGASPLSLVASEFRRLDAYQRAVALAHEVHSAVERWPLLDRQTVGPQLIRAATSVAANIAEASGRWHDPDSRRLLWIARGSLHETEFWITYAEKRGLLESGTSNRIPEIARPLSGLIRRRRSIARHPPPPPPPPPHPPAQTPPPPAPPPA